MEQDVVRAVSELTSGLAQRRKVLFAGHQDAGRSQMASAFARLYAGEQLDVACAGNAPAEKLDATVVEAMQEIDIDMGFLNPQALTDAVKVHTPDEWIAIGCNDTDTPMAKAPTLKWDLPDPVGQPMDTVRSVRDAIEQHVKSYIDTLSSH